VPASDLDQLAAAVQRVAHRCGQHRRAGGEVEYVHSIYIPEEETCFCVFRAASTNDVREVNDVEAFAIDRVSAGFGFNTRGTRVSGERGTA
jgi:Nickel responsive protein SCO4226-like